MACWRDPALSEEGQMTIFWFFFAKKNALLFEKRSKNFHSIQ
jgi:hypothetical protein